MTHCENKSKKVAKQNSTIPFFVLTYYSQLQNPNYLNSTKK